MKKLTKWLWLYLLILTLCSGCVPDKTQKPDVQYKPIPANSLVVNTGKEQTVYSLDEWMAVKRATYLKVWNSLIEKDAQLRECLEREKIKK